MKRTSALQSDTRSSPWFSLLSSRVVQQISSDAAYVKALLRDPVAPESAATAIQGRLTDRASVFLTTLERAVFAHAGSPYRPLLQAAGYDLERVRGLVTRDGLEGALQQLCLDGVYISIEEFKGITARRGAHEFQFDERAFHNPLITSGLRASSGGTRSRGIFSTISLENHRMGAEHLALTMQAYGLLSASMVVWLAHAHGASLWAVLALAALGRAPALWLSQVPVRALTARLRYQSLKFAARLCGVNLPRPRYLPLGQESRLHAWIRRGPNPHACGVFTTPSLALRLALEARRGGADLSHVTFITIGEPLTPAKLTAIRRVGARAFSSLGFAEFGRASYGCAAPVASDETHLCLDAVALAYRRRAVDRLGTQVNALAFTSLQPDARRILLNFETGDYAEPTSRRCDCPLEQMGWARKIQDIRSFEKLNAEGRLFFGSRLIELVDEILPTRFGGEITDYQLVEHEDEEGFTKLSVLVHPRLGSIDEKAVLGCVEDVLRASYEAAAEVWKEAGTVRVIRATPIMTSAGKLMPLHHLAGVS